MSSSGLPPTFTYLNIDVNTSLPENAPVNSIVYTLIAFDAEADNLTYGKVSQRPSVPDFPLNTKSGQLYSPAGIDREQTEKYQFIFE